MEANDLLTLGLGLTAPWRVVDQSLDLSKQPSELTCPALFRPAET